MAEKKSSIFSLLTIRLGLVTTIILQS